MEQEQKANLHSLVKSLYDAQKLRIQEGNRIVGNIKIRLGQAPGEKTETIDTEGQRLLKTLVLDYKRITGGDNMPECPYCGQELNYDDYYQRGLGETAQKLGDIYQCQNKSCEANGRFFYTVDTEGTGELHEGFPC